MHVHEFIKLGVKKQVFVKKLCPLSSFPWYNGFEETIKRACLRVQIEDYMPLEQETVDEMKKLLGDGGLGPAKRSDTLKPKESLGGMS